MRTPAKRHGVGGRVFRVRVEHGLTQWQFATVLGLSRHAVTEYENGGDVPWGVMVAIGEAFGVNWVWLLTGVGPAYAPQQLCPQNVLRWDEME